MTVRRVRALVWNAVKRSGNLLCFYKEMKRPLEQALVLVGNTIFLRVVFACFALEPSAGHATAHKTVAVILKAVF